MHKDCLWCKKSFEKPKRCSLREWHNLRGFCSIKCSNEWKKGRDPWNKGLKVDYNRGSKHPFWKGNKVGYRSLHVWVVRHLGLPDTCEHCGKSELKSKQIHWASKSKKYKRDLNDWIRLCAKCHWKYDDKLGVRNSPKTEFKKGHTPWHAGKTKKDFPQMSNSGVKKGNIPWNKGKKGLQVAWNKGLTKKDYPKNKSVL